MFDIDISLINLRILIPCLHVHTHTPTNKHTHLFTYTHMIWYRYVDRGVHASGGWLIPSRSGGGYLAMFFGNPFIWCVFCSVRHWYITYQLTNTNPLSARIHTHTNQQTYTLIHIYTYNMIQVRRRGGARIGWMAYPLPIRGGIYGTFFMNCLFIWMCVL